jgi:hypothetical protein
MAYACYTAWFPHAFWWLRLPLGLEMGARMEALAHSAAWACSRDRGHVVARSPPQEHPIQRAVRDAACIMELTDKPNLQVSSSMRSPLRLQACRACCAAHRCLGPVKQPPLGLKRWTPGSVADRQHMHAWPPPQEPLQQRPVWDASRVVECADRPENFVSSLPALGAALSGCSHATPCCTARRCLRRGRDAAASAMPCATAALQRPSDGAPPPAALALRVAKEACMAWQGARYVWSLPRPRPPPQGHPHQRPVWDAARVVERAYQPELHVSTLCPQADRVCSTARRRVLVVPEAASTARCQRRRA